jgi:hypothetical protein
MSEAVETPKVAKSIVEAKERLKKLNKAKVKANTLNALVRRGV